MFRFMQCISKCFARNFFLTFSFLFTLKTNQRNILIFMFRTIIMFYYRSKIDEVVNTKNDMKEWDEQYQRNIQFHKSKIN